MNENQIYLTAFHVYPKKPNLNEIHSVHFEMKQEDGHDFPYMLSLCAKVKVKKKKKVKLPLCLTQHHAMKMYWGVKV
jgi:hypothetical protein